MRKITKISMSIWLVSFMAINAIGQSKPINSKADSNKTSKTLSDVTIKFKGPKLPNVQQRSVRIPDSFKIDGASTEWNSRYQAFNKETGVYYTIANDDNNLYVIVHGTDARIISKMMEGGISFTVGNSKKINSRENATVLFPILKPFDCMEALQISGTEINDWPIGSRLLKTIKPVSINSANSLLVNNSKEIKVSGISSITDTLVFNQNDYNYLPLRLHPFQRINIKNQYGINAITQFDKNGAYNYELVIPLSYIKTFINSSSALKYNITLNGRSIEREGFYGIAYYNANDGYGHKKGDVYNEDLEYSTGFWAEYTLAK